MTDLSKKSVVNRGKRNITLRPGPDGAPRVLEPGKSIECLDEKEFKLLTGYHDIADVDKIAPQLAARESALRTQLSAAEAENKKLREQHERASVEEKEPEPRREPARSTKKKGK